MAELTYAEVQNILFARFIPNADAAGKTDAEIADLANAIPPRFVELVNAKGLPPAARIRLMTIKDTLNTHWERYVEALQKIQDEHEDEEERAKAIEELNGVMVDGIKPLPASLLVNATGPAGDLIDAGTLEILQPVLIDDLD